LSAGVPQAADTLKCYFLGILSYAFSAATTVLDMTNLKASFSKLNRVEDPHALPAYWLNGMAGTGKSTIAHSVHVFTHWHIVR
jgi:hypothetical protein